MSEHLQHNEHRNSEKLTHKEVTEHRSEQIHRKELSAEVHEHGNNEQLKNIQKSVESQAISAKEYSRGEDSESKSHPVLISKQIKNMTFVRALTRTRKRLSGPERALSKIIHNQTIDKVSEVASKTVARPPALLGGALMAFFGSIALLFVVRRFGYEYNYTIFFLLFSAGYVAGLIGESLLRTFKR